MSTFDIVMITWNRPEITRNSIKSIAENTKTPSRLIVIDNGSDKVTQDMLREFREVGIITELVLLPENLGLEPAKNIGLGYVESERFVSTDNDILAPPPDKDGDWLEQLNRLMDTYPEFVSIACRPQVLVGTGNIFEDAPEIVEFSHPGGCLRLMVTDLVRKAGGWRDEMESRGQEEMHIAGKLREMGYKSAFARDIECYHQFGDGNWGYDVPPEEHGHNPVHHPSIINGDDPDDIRKYI